MYRRILSSIIISFLFIIIFLSNQLTYFHYSFQYISLFIPFFLALNFILLLKNSSQLLKLLTYSTPILLGILYIPSTINFSLKKHTEKSLKIISYNVHGFNKPSDNDFTKTDTIATLNFIDSIKNFDADILCLQEFYDFEGHDIYNSINQIKQSGFKYYAMHPEIISRTGDIEHKFGNITISKYPIKLHDCIRYTDSGNNQVLITDIDINGNIFRFYNCHLASFNNITENNIKQRINQTFKNKKAQTESLIAHIDSSPNKVIVCGDFNDTQFGYTYHSLKQKLYSSFEEKGNFFELTFPVGFPFCRIDHIFTDENIEIQKHETLTDTKFSDHFPIKVQIKLPNNE